MAVGTQLTGDHQVQAMSGGLQDEYCFHSLKKKGLNAVQLFNFPAGLNKADNVEGFKLIMLHNHLQGGKTCPKLPRP